MVNYYFCSVYTNIRYFQISFICKIDLNALKIAFNFLIVAVDESFKLVDAVIVQLNYAVDGLTNDCRKKVRGRDFPFFSNIMETIRQISGKEVLSCRGIFL